MHDAIQADFACQTSSHVLPGGDTLPRLTTPRNPQPATSLECPVTTGSVPAGAHGAHFLMRPWSILAMPRCQRFRCALFGQENGFESQNRVPKPRRTKVYRRKTASVERIRVPRCLRRSLIHFFNTKILFMNHSEHYNFIILKIHFKISKFFQLFGYPK